MGTIAEPACPCPRVGVACALFLAGLLILLPAPFAWTGDRDGDGVDDAVDNCLDLPNPSQLDTDADLRGNACDCEFNNDGGCAQPDYSLFLECFGLSVAPGSPCAEFDMNGDGGVGQPDYSLFISFFGGPPGAAAIDFLTEVQKTSPANGEVRVAVTRETIVRLTAPLAATTVVTASDVFAQSAGQTLAVRIHVSANGKTITLFYDDPLPSSANVGVTLVGDSLSWTTQRRDGA